ncbi:hypothetical protein [Pontibacter mangrovi]|uniref:Uncharacterized protein n=1 Tax=Pontibacter mangrovi TaxID=2589816 RepID=A0A501W2U3_9BACT|nr:hypothetical protein [Pontibacter mangrovi]TPE43598.1 hypothetical protein FJM65_12645 [Pontibacter mangrovi]
MIEDMLILKYSHLDREKQLVKFLSHGSYGIYHLLTDIVLLEPTYDLLQYHSHTDLIWAKQNGFYFSIDAYGNKTDTEKIAEKDWLFIDKNDRCPSCNSKGCHACFGFGSVPAGGDYSYYFDDWD